MKLNLKCFEEWSSCMYPLIRLIIACIGMFFIPFQMVSASEDPAADVQGDISTGTLAGQFKKDGKTPLSNGRLFIYNKEKGPPSADRYVRVPDQLAELDSDGKFLLTLPAGIYFLSAVDAPEGTPMGPPPAGEPVYFKMNAKKEIQPFVVAAGKRTDAGIITSSLPHKRGYPAKKDSEITLIEGTVIDENEKPVKGAVVLAHMNPGIQEIAAYVAERTAKDGRFVLRVNDGGTYYLRVRSVYHGGAPNAGEFVNYNDPKEQVGVSLAKGDRHTGVTIKVKRQPEKGPLGRTN
jgi:hypothetical protein